jgi:carbamoyltransferase
MVLTARVREEYRHLIPAVVHRDETSRIQIVREEADPFAYAILKAMGRRLGVEMAVNTSLNVGTPIVQTPSQAIKALHRSRGLLLVGENGKVFLVWHNVEQPPKDAGRRLMRWVQEWNEKIRPEERIESVWQC